MNIDKTRSRLAKSLYRLTVWVAPTLPKEQKKQDITSQSADLDLWDDHSNFGERPF